MDKSYLKKLIKTRIRRYLDRTGTPGNYKYTYPTQFNLFDNKSSSKSAKKDNVIDRLHKRLKKINNDINYPYIDWKEKDELYKERAKIESAILRIKKPKK